MISLFRIDERLIHGQVAYAWSTAYEIDKIVVIDDQVVNDEIQKMMLKMAVPKNKGFSIFTVDEAIDYFNKNINDKEKVFVVVKKPEIVLRLVEGHVPIKSINVGGMYYKDGKEKISKTVYLDEKDKEVFNKLKSKGIESEIRTTPSDKKLNLYDFI